MNHTLVASKATIDDLEELVLLFNAYRNFYNQESDMEKARSFLSDRFKHDDSVIFVVKDVQLNQTIGFTQLYPSFSSISMQRSWILNDLYVAEESRGRGAAQVLLDTAREYAKQTNAKGLSLSTALHNETAQKIYERNGYKKDEAYFHYFLSL